MSNIDEEQVLDAPETVLSQVQALRKNIIIKLKDKEDPDSINTVLRIADSMDRQALVRMRIASDEQAGGTNKALFEAVTSVLRQIHPQKTGVATDNECKSFTCPTLSDEIATPKLVPGELDVGVSTETIESFNERMREGGIG